MNHPHQTRFVGNAVFALVVLGLASWLILHTALAGSSQSASVELGITELSPRGEVGGRAMPASAASVVYEYNVGSPNLVITDFSFYDPSGGTLYTSGETVPAGVSVIPRITIANNGNYHTSHRGEFQKWYKNSDDTTYLQRAYIELYRALSGASAGGFANQLRLDTNGDGSYDYNQTTNQSTAVSGSTSGTLVSFPPVVFSGSGSRDITAYVDVPGACTGSFRTFNLGLGGATFISNTLRPEGCIIEHTGTYLFPGYQTNLTTTLIFTDGNENDNTYTDTFTVGSSAPPPPPVSAPIVNLTANPTSVISGSSATLTWTVSGGTPDSCTASGGWSGSKNPNGGTQTLTNLTTTRTYTIVCSNAGGSGQDSATIQVTPVGASMTVDLVAPNSVAPNTPFTLQWTVNDANVCTASNGWSGSKNAADGTHTESRPGITTDTTYRLTCTDVNGITLFDEETVTVTTTPPPTYQCSDGVDNADPEDTIADYPNDPGCSSPTDNDETDAAPPPPTAPIVNLTANPTSVISGSSATLTWTVSGGTPDSCTASGGWSGSKTPTGGQQTLTNLTTTRTYTIVCTNSAGSDQDDATITVNPIPVSVNLSGPSTVNYNDSINLTWTSTGADTCNGNWGSNPKATNSSAATAGQRSSGPILQDTTFNLQCTNVTSGFNSDTHNVTVVYPQPTITANGQNSTIVRAGDPVVVDWNPVGNYTDCTLNPVRLSSTLGGNPNANDDVIDRPTSDVIYRISCAYVGGVAQATADATVTVLPSLQET